MLGVGNKRKDLTGVFQPVRSIAGISILVQATLCEANKGVLIVVSCKHFKGSCRACRSNLKLKRVEEKQIGSKSKLQILPLLLFAMTLMQGEVTHNDEPAVLTKNRPKSNQYKYEL